MEIAKLLLKLLYLVVLVVLCRLILASQTPLAGMNLDVLSFFIGVLLMYFTFDYVYRFMVNNELIVKLIGSEKEEEDDEEMEEEVYNLRGCKINEEEYDDVQFERIVLKCIARNGLKKTSFKALHHNIRKRFGYNIYKEGQKYFKNMKENN